MSEFNDVPNEREAREREIVLRSHRPVTVGSIMRDDYSGQYIECSCGQGRIRSLIPAVEYPAHILAALAARPAPVVSGEALAKAWDEGFETARRWNAAPMCRNPYRTVADAPAAEVERCPDITQAPRGHWRCILPAGHDGIHAIEHVAPAADNKGARA